MTMCHNKAVKFSREAFRAGMAAVTFASVCLTVPAVASDDRTDLPAGSYTSILAAPALLPVALTKVLWQHSPASYPVVSRILGSYWTVAETVDPIKTSSVPGSFFGTVAIPFAAISVRSQWDRVRVQKLPESGACVTSKCSLRVKAVRDAVARGKQRNFADKLALANSVANAMITYQSDRVTYLSFDHWASAKETIQRGAGDCEDFAILKQAMLRAMGVPDKSLSIIILRDNSRNLYHAVLGVSTNQGHLILDNVRGQVFRDTQVSNYQPLYSLSGSRSWIHGTQAGKTALTAKAQVPLDNVAPGESAVLPVLSMATRPLVLSELRPTLQY